MQSPTMCSERLHERDDYTAVVGLIDETVTAFRNRGHTRKLAMVLAAERLNVGLRTLHSLLFGERSSVSSAKAEAIRAAYLKHLDDEAEYFAGRLEAAKIKRREMGTELGK